MNVTAAWRNCHVSKKWQCPYGKVLPIVQHPDNKVFGIHYSGAQHTDWVRYGKVMPEFFHGGVGSDSSRLNMLIRIDRHPRLLGAVRLASTLAAAAAANVADLAPALPVAGLDEGSIDAALDMDLDVPIPLSKRNCPGLLPPRCIGYGGRTPSCGATTRSRLGNSVTAKGYLPWIAVRMVVGT